MKPFKDNVALAIDGGGIRGTLVAKALAVVEEAMGHPFAEVAQLTVGTSTGSIISAALAASKPAAEIHELYCRLGPEIFPQKWHSRFWFLKKYRYSNEPLIVALQGALGDKKVGDLWDESPPKNLVIVLHDLSENRPRFVKPRKEKYRDWYLWEAVVASSTVPTYFPVFEREGADYVDGGVGSYSNPCYVAAFELDVLLKWPLEETTLISLGTGSTKTGLGKGRARNFRLWNWVGPMLDAFTVDAAQQQMHLVEQFFEKLDFRRFQIELTESIPMDGAFGISRLTEYGEQLGRKILNDEWEEIETLDAA
jgi:patatin-like phospholipase/acyl hydrolase